MSWYVFAGAITGPVITAAVLVSAVVAALTVSAVAATEVTVNARLLLVESVTVTDWPAANPSLMNEPGVVPVAEIVQGVEVAAAKTNLRVALAVATGVTVASVQLPPIRSALSVESVLITVSLPSPP